MNGPPITRLQWPLFAAFTATVVAANWSTQRWGFVDLGPWSFTAGTYAAGLTFGIRDALQDAGSRRKVIAAIALGAVLSAWASPSLALASGVAFGVGELADFGVYTPLRERRWVGAVAASNLVGALVDTVLFLWIAFGAAAVTMQSVSGQMVGKGLMIIPGLVLVWWVRGGRG